VNDARMTFLVFVRSMIRRRKSTCNQMQEYRSAKRIPECTETMNSGRCSGKRFAITAQSVSYSS
jgi:hypothetical protein